MRGALATAVVALATCVSLRAQSPNAQDIEGTFYVDVCADADRKVKESNERNNCRASRTKITISQPAPPPLPLANSYPGLQGTGRLSFSSDPATPTTRIAP